jgi:hypothetical protein
VHFTAGSWAIEIRSCPSVLFSVQLDETTDVSDLAHLVVYTTNAVTLWKLGYSFCCATLKKLLRLQDNFLKKYENNQQDALYRLIYYSKSALHVLGDVFAHHQEHLTVFTVSGSVHPSCCRLVSWMS